MENLIFIKTEHLNIIQRYKNDFKFIEVSTRQELEEYLSKNGLKSKCLLIASTDATIALGKELGIATLAYANPEFPNQTYSGVDMIVEGFEEVDADFLEKVYQRYHHIPWTILETDRCVVKELCLDDLDGLFELYADDGMDEFTEGLYPYEEEKTYQEAYINNMYRFFGYGMWLVFLKDTGELIGRAGLEHREIYDETELELGYLIGKKYQGRGYATEVCEAILAYAKENTDFLHINCVVQKGNEASIHMAQKLGFEYREDYDIDGKVMHRFVLELS
ncbi:MAG: GNAT family N-acetyltransferase [Agathobacter sp.]|nr:GNAT family N-acetyltransferase [Agathobacter sp.]MBQ6811586.1 GNAT family N-acetyltransferase [Agathobacter sp.]